MASTHQVPKPGLVDLAGAANASGMPEAWLKAATDAGLVRHIRLGPRTVRYRAAHIRPEQIPCPVVTHAPKKPRLPTAEWVYFIAAGERGPIKIGIATDVRSRMRSHQCSNPTELLLLRAVPGGRWLEACLHEWFAPWRIRGEWFAPCAPLLRLIAGCTDDVDDDGIATVFARAAQPLARS